MLAWEGYTCAGRVFYNTHVLGGYIEDVLGRYIEDVLGGYIEDMLGGNDNTS